MAEGQRSDYDSDAAARDRTDGDDDKLIELRVHIPRWLLDVIDATCSHERREGRSSSRQTVTTTWLEKEARSALHWASVVQRVAGRNPEVAEYLEGRQT